MTITSHLTGSERVGNFELAYLGPGVYVLVAGRLADSNIVYIGRSVSEILVRVSRHADDKDFDRVGVILPRVTDELYIHNLEHYVLAEFKARYGELPHYNLNDAHFHPGGPRFNWHGIGHRRSDLVFGGGEERLAVPVRAVQPADRRCGCTGCGGCTSRGRTCTTQVRAPRRRLCHYCRSA